MTAKKLLRYPSRVTTVMHLGQLFTPLGVVRGSSRESLAVSRAMKPFFTGKIQNSDYHIQSFSVSNEDSIILPLDHTDS